MTTTSSTDKQPPPLITRIFFSIGLVCLIIIPLLCSQFTYSRSYLKIVALQVGTLFLFLSALTQRERLRDTFLPGNRLAFAIWTWLAVQVLSVLLLKNKWLSVAPLTTQASYCCSAVILMSYFAQHRNTARRAAAAYLSVIAIVIVCLVFLLEPLKLEFIPFGNRNMAGTFLILPFMLSATILFGACKERISIVRLLGAVSLFVFAGIGLYFTQCLAATLGCLCGVVVVLVVLFPDIRRQVMPAIAGGAAITILAVLFVPTIRHRILDGIYYSTAGIRLLIWGGAARAFLHTWGMGSGVGSFFVSLAQWELPLYYGHPNASSIVFYAHNLYLHTAVELGFIGFAALTWLAAESLRSGFRAWKDSSGSQAIVKLGVFGALIGILVDSLFSTSPHSPEAQINFWLILVAFGATRISDKRRATTHHRPDMIESTRRVVLSIIAIVLTSIAVFGGSRWLPTSGGLFPQHDLTRGINLKRELEAELAGPARSGKGADTERIQALLSESMERLARAHQYTYEPEVFIASALHLARIHYYLGEYTEALTLHDDIERLCPGLGDTDMNLAALFRAQDEPRKAGERLLKYLNKNRYNTTAYEHLFMLSEERGYMDLAAEALPLLGNAIQHTRWNPDKQLHMKQLHMRFQRLVLSDSPSLELPEHSLPNADEDYQSP